MKPMKNILAKLTWTIAVGSGCLLGCCVQASETVCDNGLKGWQSDTNHTFGVWVAKSTRIVKTDDGKYHTQFRDCDGTNQVWTAIYEGDKTYDELFWAQYHLKNSFAIKKGICDAFEDIGKHDKPKAP